MTAEKSKIVHWHIGPLFGFGICTFIFVVGTGGPGFFFLAAFAALAFIMAMPLAQFLILKIPKFRGNYSAACWLAFGLIVLSVIALIAGGVFNIC
jgi:hypothetical protein